MSANESSSVSHSLTLAKSREVVAILKHVPLLPNGEQSAILMRQQPNLAWVATGKSFPLITGSEPTDVEDMALAVERKTQYLAWGRAMLLRAVIAQRGCKTEEGVAGASYWAPTRLTANDTATEEGDVVLFPVADVSDETVEACFDALCEDYNNGGPFRGAQGTPGDPAATGEPPVSDGGEVSLPAV